MVAGVDLRLALLHQPCLVFGRIIDIIENVCDLVINRVAQWAQRGPVHVGVYGRVKSHSDNVQPWCRHDVVWILHPVSSESVLVRLGRQAETQVVDLGPVWVLALRAKHCSLGHIIVTDFAGVVAVTSHRVFDFRVDRACRDAVVIIALVRDVGLIIGVVHVWGVARAFGAALLRADDDRALD